MSASTKITREQLARHALIYVRQSTPGQLTLHPESTARQYALRQRAYDLGWPPDAVEVIDRDLGKSGASTTDRDGFQYLVAEVGLGHVGLVLSLETSRLARSGGDWYHLLELCALAQTLIADEDGVYDPAQYNDRLLLGLKGTMSEAELHLLRQRLVGGARHKAARGDLRIPLPTGYVWGSDADGQPCIQLDPDASVRAGIQHVFDVFARVGSAAQVLKTLVRDGTTLPQRRRTGLAKGTVTWDRPSAWRITAILKNPLYAGAYAYGRHRRWRPGDPRPSGRSPSAHSIVALPPMEWAVLLRDHHPAYIAWATYERTGTQLAQNHADFRQGHPGAPQKGAALLQGILRCGRCGRQLRLRYTGPASDLPVYVCEDRAKALGEPRCQEVRARAIDPAVAEVLLAALTPAQVEAALQVVTAAEAAVAVERDQWRQRRDRAQYAAERAWRQYDAVEPEHRLVARELEARWNARVREQQEVEAAYTAALTAGQLTLTDAERDQLRHWATTLPTVWADPRTTAADRKRLLRCVLETVVVTTDKTTDRITLALHWQSGLTTTCVVSRPVRQYRTLGRYPHLIARIRALAEAGRTDKQIAALLQTEGLRPARVRAFHAKTIWLLRHAHHIPSGSLRPPPLRAQRQRFTVQTLARELGVLPGAVYRWIAKGQLPTHQHIPWGPHTIDLRAADLATWRAQVTQTHQRMHYTPPQPSRRRIAPRRRAPTHQPI